MNAPLPEAREILGLLWPTVQPDGTAVRSGSAHSSRIVDKAELVGQSGDCVAFAALIRKQPLDVYAKPFIILFAKTDQSAPNPITTALIRAGDLADRATFYRHDLVFIDPNHNPTGREVPKNPHT